MSSTLISKSSPDRFKLYLIGGLFDYVCMFFFFLQLHMSEWFIFFRERWLDAFKISMSSSCFRFFSSKVVEIYVSKFRMVLVSHNLAPLIIATIASSDRVGRSVSSTTRTIIATIYGFLYY